MGLVKPCSKIILGTIILLQLSCHEENSNFTIQFPTGWEIIDSTSKLSGRYIRMYQSSPKKNSERIIPNIIISIHKFPNKSLYITGVLRDIEENSLFFQKIGKGDTTIRNVNWRWERHLVQFKHSGRVEQKVFFAQDEGEIYQLIYTASENEFKDFENAFFNVVRSFEISN